jgi:hypothetical protein
MCLSHHSGYVAALYVTFLVLRPQCRRIVITPLTERPGRDAELNSRRGHEIVHRLQNITAPSVFNPRAFFDGKKNLFSVGPLKMQGDAAEVSNPRFRSRYRGMDSIAHTARLPDTSSSWSVCLTRHNPPGVPAVNFA